MRGDVQQQTPQELHGVKRQGAQAVAALVILVAEGHLAVFQGDKPVVRDGHAMRITGQVLQDVLRGLERLFGVDDPLLVAQRGEEALPGCRLGECLTATRQGEVTLCVGLCKAGEVEAPEAPREDPDGPEEVGATRHPPRAISRDPPGRWDTMEMGGMVELWAPGVEHRRTAGLRPEMLRIPSDV